MSILDRESTVAPPGFNRWLIPPAALAVHLSIGQVYAFSVFKLPLAKVLGVGPSEQASLAWIFSIAIAFLGISAAVFGKWVEKSGPRKTMLAAACCFGGGFLVSALGVGLHQLWILYLGYGVLGGCGLGLGYISPVSTLVKWFPDRPGMATGMAIMGFGGGALIGSNLSLTLMDAFKSSSDPGVAPAFIAMGAIYFVFILFGAWIVRVPAADWKPAGYTPSTTPQKLVTTANVALDQAWRTPQFWLLWVVLCFNVTAGIGILAQASPMIQEMFPAGGVHKGVTAAAAGGFVALLSLFNMAGRFLWSSLSDYTGRKAVYVIYLLLGAVLYCLIPLAAHSGSATLFVAICVILLSMYGGGFATIPAYLKDLFGTMQVGAIHGRLLTAWSMAGILGPVLVNELRDRLHASGVTGVSLYAPTMYLMAGLLIIGLICNLLVRPVDERYHCHGDPSRPVGPDDDIPHHPRPAHA
ncbi:MAG: OFA family MFS transporter [Chthoniobacter sp.]|uniref:L-lactate MFS transporter n=1 Tax=Chthoniobacter sp. TaxID=2510640 RepID=UPI0032A9DFB8